MLATLKSTRFYAMVVASASAVLIDPSFGTQTWYISLGKFLGLLSTGFVIVNTSSKYEKKDTVVEEVK